MYKELISKFSGLHIDDIYNTIVEQKPEMKTEFEKYKIKPYVRGNMIEYFTYLMCNQTKLYYQSKFGPDFEGENEIFDMKCISLRKRDNWLSGDTPISKYDGKSYNESNVINKLSKIIIPLIDKDGNIIKVLFFDKSKIDNELRKEWQQINYYLTLNKDGSVPKLKYLRCKNMRGYHIFFTFSKKHSLLNISDVLSESKRIKNPQEYIKELQKEYSKRKSLSYRGFLTMIDNGEFKQLYKEYIN